MLRRAAAKSRFCSSLMPRYAVGEDVDVFVFETGIPCNYILVVAKAYVIQVHEISRPIFHR